MRHLQTWVSSIAQSDDRLTLQSQPPGLSIKTRLGTYSTPASASFSPTMSAPRSLPSVPLFL
jgi:hypothetical protein